MSRTFWKGTIRFGRIRIPVSLRAGAGSKGPEFELVDVRDFSPIGYRKVNKNTEEEVPARDIVRTYPVGRGEAVVVTDVDIARARPKGLHTLIIDGFLRPSEIPMAYFDAPYILEPEEGDLRAYLLLRETLKRTRKAALTRAVIGTREHLGLIVGQGAWLHFNTLRFPDELREREAPPELRHAPLPPEEELAAAERLVDAMQTRWNPVDYHDRYREELLSYIHRKAEAGEARRVFEPEPEKVENAPAPETLRSLLEESLSERRESKPARRRRPAS